jgi:hypothetical protein
VVDVADEETAATSGGCMGKNATPTASHSDKNEGGRGRHLATASIVLTILVAAGTLIGYLATALEFLF